MFESDSPAPRAPTYVDFLSIEEDDQNDSFSFVNGSPDGRSFSPQLRCSRVNKDVSMFGQRRIVTALTSLSLQNNASTGDSQSVESPSKDHGMTTRQDVDRESRTIVLRSRNVTVQPKSSGFTSPPRKKTRKMTLAESILHFQKDTPPRFRSVAPGHKPGEVANSEEFRTEERRPITVPQSPELSTMNLKCRNKPRRGKENIPGQDEVTRERKIHSSQELPLPETREFSRTPEKQDDESPEDECTNEENPPSLRVESNPQKRTRRKWVVPEISWADIFNVQSESGKAERKSDQQSAERDRKRLLERDEKLKKIREAKSKPSPLRALPRHGPSASPSAHRRCVPSPKSRAFQARPPMVLHQRPFSPRIAKNPSVQPVDIALNTEARAQRRRELELLRKAKEEELEKARNENELVRKKLERRQIVQLRKSLVHKPVPIPRFK